MTHPREDVLCGECASPMILRETTKYPNPDGTPRRFFGCSSYPQCRGTHGAHQATGEPLGIPADEPTKKARMAVHAVFDRIWKDRHLPRNDAYRLLQELTSKSADKAHISMFTQAECAAVLPKLEHWLSVYEEPDPDYS